MSRHADLLSAHAEHVTDLRSQLEWERARSQSLMEQIQANAQGFQHYPTVTREPVDPNAPVVYMTDETGLVEVPIYADELAEIKARHEERELV